MTQTQVTLTSINVSVFLEGEENKNAYDQLLLKIAAQEEPYGVINDDDIQALNFPVDSYKFFNAAYNYLRSRSDSDANALQQSIPLATQVELVLQQSNRKKSELPKFGLSLSGIFREHQQQTQGEIFFPNYTELGLGLVARRSLFDSGAYTGARLTVDFAGGEAQEKSNRNKKLVKVAGLNSFNIGLDVLLGFESPLLGKYLSSHIFFTSGAAVEISQEPILTGAGEKYRNYCENVPINHVVQVDGKDTDPETLNSDDVAAIDENTPVTLHPEAQDNLNCQARQLVPLHIRPMARMSVGVGFELLDAVLASVALAYDWRPDLAGYPLMRSGGVFNFVGSLEYNFY